MKTKEEKLLKAKLKCLRKLIKECPNWTLIVFPHTAGGIGKSLPFKK